MPPKKGIVTLWILICLRICLPEGEKKMSHFPPAGRTSCLSACSQDQSRAGPLHCGLRMNGYRVCVYGCRGEQKAIFGIQRERETSRRVLLAWHRCIMSCCSLLPLVADLCQRLKGFLGSFLSGGHQGRFLSRRAFRTPSVILVDTELEN